MINSVRAVSNIQGAAGHSHINPYLANKLNKELRKSGVARRSGLVITIG